MANAVYYGKSITAGNEAIKKVYLNDSSITADTLQEGDLLVVYFAYGLEVDNPSLALYIGDANEEISVSESSGKVIYNTSSHHAQAGDWTDGEVVTFSYTTNKQVVIDRDNTYYWEMVATVRATEENYGRVILDINDAAAATVGKVKDLIEDSHVTIDYNQTFEGNSQQIGILTITDPTKETQVSSYSINIPTAVMPDSLADFAESNLLPFNEATQLGYIPEEGDFNNFITILSLDVGENHDVDLSSPNNIYINPATNGFIEINGKLKINGELDITDEVTAHDTITAAEGISTNGIEVFDGVINAENIDTYLGDTIVKSINITNGNNVVNGTTTFNGPIIGLPDATLGDTTVTSLNIGNTALNDYIDSRIPAYEDPTNGLIITDEHSSAPFRLDVGKYYVSDGIRGVLIGDFAKPGYTILGVLNWTVGDNSTGTNVHFASVYGLWWSGTKLYCKIYNCGTKAITDAVAKATVLYRKNS